MRDTIQTPPTLRILVVDDHDLVRAGLTSLINHLPGIEVVGEANDGDEALKMISDVTPDIVLMDISMPPGLSGLETTRIAVKKFPGVRIIILSMHAIDEYVLDALQAGAVGYLLKDASPTELGQAIEMVSHGEIYISPSISKNLLTYIQDRSKHPHIEELTGRQLQILKLIGAGCTTIDIANRLHISPKTVGAHRQNIMKRLNIYEVSGLIRYAIQRDLVSPDE